MAIDTQWDNRIIEFGVKNADQFTFHPDNPRIHPEAQTAGTEGSLSDLGWLKPVIENQRTGYLIDGHDRVQLARARGNQPVPFVLVDLPEEREAEALLILDRLTEMARFDPDALRRLSESIESSHDAINLILHDLAQEYDILPEFDTGNASSNSDEGDDPGVLTEIEPSRVRMVNLFLDEETVQEFNDLTYHLSKRYGTDNPTDTVMEALRREADHG